MPVTPNESSTLAALDVRAAVIDMALAGLDLQDRDLRLAVDDFRKAHAADAGDAKGRVLARLGAPETLSALAERHRAFVLWQAARRKAALAEDRFDTATAAVKQAIREHEDVDPEGDWRVDVHRLVVLDDSAPKRELLACAAALVRGAQSGELPAKDALAPTIKQLAKDTPGAGEFIADLIDVLTSASMPARERLAAMLGAKQMARQMRDDDELPKPVRFLAGLVLEYGEEE